MLNFVYAHSSLQGFVIWKYLRTNASTNLCGDGNFYCRNKQKRFKLRLRLSFIAKTFLISNCEKFFLKLCRLMSCGDRVHKNVFKIFREPTTKQLALLYWPITICSLCVEKPNFLYVQRNWILETERNWISTHFFYVCSLFSSWT